MNVTFGPDPSGRDGLERSAQPDVPVQVCADEISGNHTDLIDHLKETTSWMNMTATATISDLLTVQAFSCNSTVVSTNSTISIDYVTGETTPTGGRRFSFLTTCWRRDASCLIRGSDVQVERALLQNQQNCS
jgi:hypothetical protein